MYFLWELIQRRQEVVTCTGTRVVYIRMRFRVGRHIFDAFVLLHIQHHIRIIVGMLFYTLPHVPKSRATTEATNAVVILLFMTLEWCYNNHN